MHILSGCFLQHHLSLPFTNCPYYTPPTWPLPNAMTSSPTTLLLTLSYSSHSGLLSIVPTCQDLGKSCSLCLDPPSLILSNLNMNGFFLLIRFQLKCFHWPLSLKAAPLPLWSSIASPYFNSLQCTQLLSLLDIFSCLFSSFSSLFTICLPY